MAENPKKHQKPVLPLNPAPLSEGTSFKERLEYLIETYRRAGWSLEYAVDTIAEAAGVSRGAVYKWRNGSSAKAEHIANLVRSEEMKKLKLSADWLLATDTPLNEQQTVAIGKTLFNDARLELIKQTQAELLIVGRTGSTFDLTRFLPEIKNVMRDRKIKLKLVLSDPDDPCSTKMIALARTSVTDTSEAASDTIRKTIDQLERRAGETKAPKPEIKTIPYVASYHACIRDPGTGNGEALVIMVNFRSDEYSYAPLLRVTEASQKELFQFFVDDFYQYWNCPSHL